VICDTTIKAGATNIENTASRKINTENLNKAHLPSAGESLSLAEAPLNPITKVIVPKIKPNDAPSDDIVLRYSILSHDLGSSLQTPQPGHLAGKTRSHIPAIRPPLLRSGTPSRPP